jgi:hypothetical protein
MDARKLKLTLIPGPDDPPLKTPEYQVGLRQFKQSLNSQGVEVTAVEIHEFSDLGFAGAAGEYSIRLAATVGPALATAVGVWLHARYGRKVRVKIGEIEAEAQTVEDVEKLLDRAQEMQQRNQPKAIHEP